MRLGKMSKEQNPIYTIKWWFDLRSEKGFLKYVSLLLIVSIMCGVTIGINCSNQNIILISIIGTIVIIALMAIMHYIVFNALYLAHTQKRKIIRPSKDKGF